MTTWIVCGVLQRELESLIVDKSLDGEILAPDSMLHMHPNRLEQNLRGILSSNSLRKPVVIVYGDCCAGMVELQRLPQVAKIKATNCVQMLVNDDHYRDLMRREAFILLPEWTHRWETVFREELGLTNPELAREVIGDNRRELVYFDTGLVEVPEKAIRDCSEFVGLPWSIEKIRLDYFLTLLKEAETKLHAENK